MTRLIGVVHLAALPGSPRAELRLPAIVENACRDATALEAGGVDAIIVENFNDAPFRAGPVEAHTVAAMTVAVQGVRAAVRVDVGVNVLRNDAAAALGIAAATGARFIRVNVHTGAMLTDQGIITGRADDTLRLRRQLNGEGVEVYADVLVKHAVPLGPLSVAEAVRDAVDRGLADAVIVSGSATGVAASVCDVIEATRATHVPVYVGSGVTADNVTGVVPPAAGVIVGTWLKRDGLVANEVDVRRVQLLRAALDRCVAAEVEGIS